MCRVYTSVMTACDQSAGLAASARAPNVPRQAGHHAASSLLSSSFSACRMAMADSDTANAAMVAENRVKRRASAPSGKRA